MAARLYRRKYSGSGYLTTTFAHSVCVRVPGRIKLISGPFHPRQQRRTSPADSGAPDDPPNEEAELAVDALNASKEVCPTRKGT